MNSFYKLEVQAVTVVNRVSAVGMATVWTAEGLQDLKKLPTFV
jgi:hypothetical protein